MSYNTTISKNIKMNDIYISLSMKKDEIQNLTKSRKRKLFYDFAKIHS